jgi:hypothetical protein
LRRLSGGGVASVRYLRDGVDDGVEDADDFDDDERDVE